MNYIDFKPKAKTTTLEVIDQEKVSNQDVQDLKKLIDNAGGNGLDKPTYKVNLICLFN